ncbi:hypothetical protein V1527DRAFT_516379 [Lipomyces starkeyi]
MTQAQPESFVLELTWVWCRILTMSTTSTTMIRVRQLNALFSGRNRATWARSASQLINQRRYIDWASLGRELQTDDHVEVGFRLRLFCYYQSAFETISMHLGFWSKRYRASTLYLLPFPLERRAIYLGSSDRLQWILVMKPAFGYVWPSDKAEMQELIRQGVTKCTTSRDDARILLQRALGAQAEWKNFGVDRQVEASRAQWLSFQELFCQGYNDHFGSLDEDHFFRTHEPAFHVFDYGQDLPVGNATTSFDDHLVEQLSAEFNMDGVEMVGTALALNVGVTDRHGHHLSSLVDFHRCVAEFPEISSRTFFPLRFLPRVGHVQSTEPPVSLFADLLSGIIEQTKAENSGNEVVRAGPFQMYSMLKQSIRPTTADLLVRRGYCTASWSVDEGMIATRRHHKRYQQVQVYTNPANPNDDRVPIRREGSRMRRAQETQNDNLRFEFNLAFLVSNAQQEHANFAYFIERVFGSTRQAIVARGAAMVKRFVIVFEPTVFPGVLVSFLHMLYAIQADLANKDFSAFRGEAVSFIERLALYGLTGDPLVIPTRLRNTLGTREALVHRGWPFVRARYLDFVNIKIGAQGWPRLILEPLLHTKPGIIYNYDHATFLRFRNYRVEREFGQQCTPD